MKLENGLLKYNLLILCCLIGIGCSQSNKTKKYDYKKNIQKNKELLLKEPGNCFYIQQIASSYQALHNFEKAISYYKKTKSNCRNNLHLLNKFQMGVCYYLKGDFDNGIRYMDEAIKDSEKINDIELSEMFKREKKFWLKNSGNPAVTKK